MSDSPLFDALLAQYDQIQADADAELTDARIQEFIEDGV